ncbi:MAG TPA: hypothetical protein VFS21_16450 [Roseiflexaceae bacterium]|nr:hypothetical protein [Roseiflexaceae bacterium]
MPAFIDRRDREGDLALVLYTLWRIADTTLRKALEVAIRDYAERHIGFSARLRRATEQPPQPVVAQAGDAERAAALHTVWRLGDGPLREAIQQIIRDEVRRRPESLLGFRATVALHDRH